MTNTWIRIYIAMIFLFPLTLLGQDKDVSVSYRVQVKDVSFHELLDKLEKSYDVQFSYQSDLLQSEVFSLKTNTPDLSDILKEISAIYPLEYQILSDQSILLRQKLSPQIQKAISSIQIVIFDAENHSPLSEVAVGIQGTTTGDYSNEEGIVILDIPVSQDTTSLEIHLLGYKSVSIPCTGQTKYKIELKPQAFEVDEVMVKDRADIVKIGKTDHSVVLHTSHITSFTSGLAGQDLVRQAQLLPGVAAYDDKSAGLKIRGSEEESSLIILDDIPIYNASHYYGLFSSINPDFATSSTLYKNNLPVSYDGKTAGMLQVNGPEADSLMSARGSLSLNMLTASGAVSLPISDDVLWTIAGRTSYGNVSETDFFSLFSSPEEENVQVENFSLSTRDKLLSTVPDFTFFDLNSKLQHRWDNGLLEINYYQSSDDLDDIFENEFRTRRQQFQVLNSEFYNNSEDWQNRGFNLKVENNISPDLSISSIFYSTNYKNLSGLEIDLSRKFLREEASFNYQNFRENEVDDIGLKTSFHLKKPGFSMSGGIDLVDHEVKMKVTEQGRTIDQRDFSKIESSAFIAIQPVINDAFSLDAGIRGTVYNQSFYPAPRINMAYSINPEWRLKSSIGRHNQYVRQITFENIFGRSLDFWVLSDEDGIKVSKADQVMLGATYRKGRFSLDVESYYRYRHNVLELALFNPRFDQASILPLSSDSGNAYRPFTGNSQTYGVDILASATFPNYSGWLSYTLSKSDTQYDQILRGTSFPSQDDRRHQVNFIHEYRIGNLTLGANFTYASGRPYTDLNKVAATLRRDELRPEDRISRLPDYFRTDIGVTYAIEMEYSWLELGISAYNLLNRQNVNYIQYLFSIPTNSSNNPNATINTLLGQESTLLNRTVNLSMAIKF